jgi:hypothetical protein
MEFEEPPSHAESRENEKNLTEYAEDAEEAVMNMIQDHMVENLNDPDIWHLVNDFMDRMVRLLSHLENLHEETKPNALGEIQEEHGEGHGEDCNGDSGDMLDELREKIDGNEHDHGGDYGGDYGEERYNDEDYDQQGEGYDHEQYDHDDYHQHC